MGDPDEFECLEGREDKIDGTISVSAFKFSVVRKRAGPNAVLNRLVDIIGIFATNNEKLGILKIVGRNILVEIN